MTGATGRWVPLSPARKMVLEILHQTRGVPSLPLAKRMQLGRLAAARRGTGISWPAVFVRAYALLAAEQPGLRRAYVRWPWPHLYEHPQSVCAVIVERDLAGEPVVLTARIAGPEHRALGRLEGALTTFRDA